MVKIIKQNREEVIFQTKVSQVTGRYKGILIPFSISDDFNIKQEVLVCIKKVYTKKI